MQRELDAVKAERRRRQQALYDIRPQVSHVSGSLPPSPSSPVGGFPAAVHATMCAKTTVRDDRGDGGLPPYKPETAVPRQLLTMAYVPRPDGRLSPCPKHFMGDHVESLDLSPWDISSAEETGSLWQVNRRVDSSVPVPSRKRWSHERTAITTYIHQRFPN